VLTQSNVVIKSPAQMNSSDGEYQGMILLNPGGPGGSGVALILDFQKIAGLLIGTNYGLFTCLRFLSMYKLLILHL
jgi:hypothetical protein